MRGCINLFMIAVCDRNQDVVRELKSWAEIDGKKLACNIGIACYKCAEELLWDMEEGYTYDAVFLEYEINHCKGIEYAKMIRKTNEICEIVFIANSAQYAYEAYSVHPFFYMKKPIDRGCFDEVFTELCNLLMESKNTFSFYSFRKYYQILLKNILYFQSDRSRVTLFCIGGEQYSYYNTLKDVEQCLQTLSLRFIRPHQSFLVNCLHIKTCHYDRIELRNGEIIPISEDRRKKVRNQYYLGG